MFKFDHALSVKLIRHNFIGCNFKMDHYKTLVSSYKSNPPFVEMDINLKTIV